MKKHNLSISLLFLLSVLFTANSLFSAELNSLFYDASIGLGFNTFRLNGDNTALQQQFLYSSSEEWYAGGGLRYTEPGIDVLATLFIDSNYKHRVVIGGELTFMEVKEARLYYDEGIQYFIHKVQFGDIYVGYHYSFYKADWQNVRLFAGLELMLNTVYKNDQRYYASSFYEGSLVSEFDITYKKESATRIGSRIRAGFEGQLYDNFYISSSCALGIYNLLLRDDSTGELFNKPTLFDKKESFQPFFNFIISFQYRFNAANISILK